MRIAGLVISAQTPLELDTTFTQENAPKIGILILHAMKLLDLTHYNLPQDQQCFTTKQELFDLISTYVKAVINDTYNLFITSETTPAVSDNDKVWIQVDANGAIIDVKTYASGLWRGRNTRMIGTIFWNGSETAPSPTAHWHKCDGSTLAIASYGDLYSVIGTNFNTGGEGAGNFRLPDILGRDIIGTGAGTGLTPRTIGDSGGYETHTLIAAELPTHTHAIDTWQMRSDGTKDSCGAVYPFGTYCGPIGTTGTIGSDDPHNNMQPYLAVPAFIRITA